jgi:Uma2 family endonuclease
MVTQHKVTADEFEAFLQRDANAERRFELINGEIVEIYQPHADIQILTAGDTISGAWLLPGFTLPVADVFAA